MTEVHVKCELSTAVLLSIKDDVKCKCVNNGSTTGLYFNLYKIKYLAKSEDKQHGSDEKLNTRQRLFEQQKSIYL